MKDRLAQSLRAVIGAGPHDVAAAHAVSTSPAVPIPHSAPEPLAVPASQVMPASPVAPVFFTAAPGAAPQHAGVNAGWHDAAPSRRRISILGTMALSCLISAGLFAMHFATSARRSRSDSDFRSAERDRSIGRVAFPRDDLSEPVPMAPRQRKPGHTDDAFSLADAKDLTDDLLLDGPKHAPAASAAQRMAPVTEEGFGDADSHNRQSLDEPANSAAVAAQSPSAPPTPELSSGAQGPEAPAPEASAKKPELRGADQSYALFDDQPADPRADVAKSAVGQPARNASQGSGGKRNINFADWNFPLSKPPANTAGASGLSQQSPVAPNATDPSGPVILPGPADLNSRHHPAARVDPVSAQQAGAPYAPPDLHAAAPSPPKDPTPTWSPSVEPSAPAAPSVPQAPAENPLAALDKTKVMSFDMQNAPWGTVLGAYAKFVGLELRMDAIPSGTFNYRDQALYTPSQVLAILNALLVPRGYQLRIEGQTLHAVALAGKQ